MWVSRTRTSFGIRDLLQTPLALVNWVFMKIVNPYEPIVAAENINEALIQDGGVTVTGWGRGVVDR